MARTVSRPFHWALNLGINTRVVDRAAIEPNRTESQVRSRKLELGSWKSEVGSWKSEVGNRKSEVRSKKWERGSGKWEIRSRKAEVGSGKWEVRRSSHSALSLNGQKSETQSSYFVKSEVWSLKYEVLSLKSEVRSWKSEVGSRKTLLGFRIIRITEQCADWLQSVERLWAVRFPRPDYYSRS